MTEKRGKRASRRKPPISGLEVTVFKCGHVQSVRTVDSGPNRVSVSRSPCSRCWSSSVRTWWTHPRGPKGN
jgi:hypothetical protein